MTATEVNVYGRQLSAEEIARGEHRDFVGGMWERLGELQFEFLLREGLRPESRLLDVGCGALRGGLHFIRHLEPGRYCGMDINASLLDAGRLELAAVGLEHKSPQLLADERFDLRRFGVRFDFVLAVSVFTHLPLNHIVRCLVEARRVLAPGGRFYASWFEAPRPAHLDALTHNPGGIVTCYDRDPFHLSVDEIAWAAALAGLATRRIGDWGHPRDQQMLVFSCDD